MSFFISQDTTLDHGPFINSLTSEISMKVLIQERGKNLQFPNAYFYIASPFLLPTNIEQ